MKTANPRLLGFSSRESLGTLTRGVLVVRWEEEPVAESFKEYGKLRMEYNQYFPGILMCKRADDLLAQDASNYDDNDIVYREN
jgi:hypothetical protein